MSQRISNLTSGSYIDLIFECMCLLYPIVRYDVLRKWQNKYNGSKIPLSSYSDV
jgi:hypothetical protein